MKDNIFSISRGDVPHHAVVRKGAARIHFGGNGFGVLGTPKGRRRL